MLFYIDQYRFLLNNGHKLLLFNCCACKVDKHWNEFFYMYNVYTYIWTTISRIQMHNALSYTKIHPFIHSYMHMHTCAMYARSMLTANKEWSNHILKWKKIGKWTFVLPWLFQMFVSFFIVLSHPHCCYTITTLCNEAQFTCVLFIYEMS